MKDRYDIALLVPGMPFDGDTLKTKSLGGSESAGYYMAKAIAALGHNVAVFSNCEKPMEADGVNYRPIPMWAPFSTMTPFDIAVVQRAPEMFSGRINSRLNILWCHDLGLRRQQDVFSGVQWNIDKTIVLSRFMLDQYKDTYGVPEKALWLSRNGIDLSAFKPQEKPRDPFHLVYSARPERGLDILLDRILPELLKRDQRYHLSIAGYDNPVDHMREFYGGLMQKSQIFGPAVKWVGNLSKAALYELYSLAGCYVYPTPGAFSPDFREISCISAMECQAAGLPIVTSAKGALVETVREGAGTLVEGDPKSDEYIEEFCDEVQLWGGETTSVDCSDMDWGKIAEEWLETFEQLLTERSRPMVVKGEVPQPKERGIDPYINSFKEKYPDGKFYDLTASTSILGAPLVPNGKVGQPHMVILPYGPWRAGVRPYTSHDLRDIFKSSKNEVTVQAMGAGVNPVTEEPVGWWVICYLETDKPCGLIDESRDNRLGRGHQTVSGTMIAGPGAEDTLRWCLKSVAPYVDELVIGDTGMSQEAKDIAHEFGAKLVPAASPLEEGFETPRNQALEHCTKEWVFWIDSDERLMDGHKLAKYLRANTFDGYSIKQHHFAGDAQFQPDMPVRLFRRTPDMRWYGMLHEHPEKGLNEGPGSVVIINDLWIAHLGYLAESGRRQRFARNEPLLKMDKEKYPDRLLQKHFIMRDNIIKAGYILQLNGGRVNDECRRLAQEVIDLYRQYFRDENKYANIDSLPYYSEACAMLNLGAEVSFQISAGRDGKGNLNGGPRYRFADEEDLVAELTKRGKSAIAPFIHRHW